MSIRLILGLLVLISQIFMIATARFHPMRYFCWAPYDSQNEYEIHAYVEGRELSPTEVYARYQLRTPSVNPRMIYQVTGTVQDVEQTYHKADPARVVVVYRTNGAPELTWHWPQE